MKGLLKWRKEDGSYRYHADVPFMPGYQYFIVIWDSYFNGKKLRRAKVWLSILAPYELVELSDVKEPVELLFSLRDAKKVAEADFLNRFPLIALSLLRQS